MSKWWLLSDNYEGEVLAFVCLFQFINNAAVFNFGYKFRQSFHKNYVLVILWLAYLAIASYWLLADPNPFGCLVSSLTIYNYWKRLIFFLYIVPFQLWNKRST